MIGKTNSNSGLGNAYAYIIVDYPEGSTCTATNGYITLTAPNKNGHVRFAVPEPTESNSRLEIIDYYPTGLNLLSTTYVNLFENFVNQPGIHYLRTRRQNS